MIGAKGDKATLVTSIPLSPWVCVVMLGTYGKVTRVTRVLGNTPPLYTKKKCVCFLCI
jgi:hypothetical protein